MRWSPCRWLTVEIILVASLVSIVSTGCFRELSGGDYAVRRLALGEGAFEEVTGFGANPGGLKMFRYLPADMPSDAPLVVVLHACTQTAPDSRSFGWEVVADAHKFYVIYPEQQTSNNAMRCFNWAGEYGDPANLERGQGENESIIEMVEQMQSDYSIDDGRIYVTGQSAGGAQTALMLATWPDVFEAGSILAGIPYHCTTEFMDVYSCLNPGHDQTPEQWGDLVRGAYPDYDGPYPRVSLWHGTSDIVVSQSNLTELLEQWSDVHGIDRNADVEDEVEGYTHRLYRDGLGEAIIEVYELQGQGHGVFIDPANGCGSVGNYIIDAGICSAFYSAEFFGIVEEGPPVGDPVGDVDPDTSDVGWDTPDAGLDIAGPDVSPDLGGTDAAPDAGWPDAGGDTDGQTGDTLPDNGSCPPCSTQDQECDCGCSLVPGEAAEVPGLLGMLAVCALVSLGSRRKRTSAR